MNLHHLSFDLWLTRSPRDRVDSQKVMEFLVWNRFRKLTRCEKDKVYTARGPTPATVQGLSYHGIVTNFTSWPQFENCNKRQHVHRKKYLLDLSRILAFKRRRHHWYCSSMWSLLSHGTLLKRFFNCALLCHAFLTLAFYISHQN